MAKRKNPLKDLDAFLKQEASSFVKPDNTPQQEVPRKAEGPVTTTLDIIRAIEKLAKQDPANYREELYEIIKSSIQQLDRTSVEDKMLINTILYLKDKNNWKETVRQYWKEHN